MSVGEDASDVLVAVMMVARVVPVDVVIVSDDGADDGGTIAAGGFAGDSGIQTRSRLDACSCCTFVPQGKSGSSL